MIREIKGDLWDLHAAGHRIVITTNIGWDPETLRNNMGAGIALQAAQRYPRLPRWYGRLCRQLKHGTPVVAHPKHTRLIFLPVKPLLSLAQPERSWDQVASIELIERGLKQLLALPGQIALSTPGAGNGKLPEAVVADLVRRVLSTDPNPRRFVLVQYAHAAARRDPVTHALGKNYRDIWVRNEAGELATSGFIGVDFDMSRIEDHLREYGAAPGLVRNEAGEIVGGRHRHEAAERLNRIVHAAGDGVDVCLALCGKWCGGELAATDTIASRRTEDVEVTCRRCLRFLPRAMVSSPHV